MGLLFGKSDHVFIAYLMLYVLNSAVGQSDIEKNISTKGEVGGEAVITCRVGPDYTNVEWYLNRTPVKLNERINQTNEIKENSTKDADGNHFKYQEWRLIIKNATAKDAGEYICKAVSPDGVIEYAAVLDLGFPAKLVKMTDGVIRMNATDNGNVTLMCEFEVYNQTQVKWYKADKDDDISEPETLVTTKLKQIDSKRFQTTYALNIKRPEDNGTYVCEIQDQATSTAVQGMIDVIVYAEPKVIIDKVIPISSSQLYINWTVNAYNSPVKTYNLMYRKGNSSDYQLYTREKIGPRNTSFVMEGLDNSTEYQIKLEVTTQYGQSKPYTDQHVVRTLDADPIFVPNISINGHSATSVTIDWAPPAEDIAQYIHYYILEARKKGENEPKIAYHYNSNNLPYMFQYLEPHSTYIFRVRACSEFTKKCSNWSADMTAITGEGIPGKPSNVTLVCYRDEANVWHMNLTWEPPVKPNAEIKSYTVEVTGNSTYRDSYGKYRTDIWGPKTRTVTDTSRSFRMGELSPNTNYTVRVSARARIQKYGDEESRHCGAGTAPPRDAPRPRWNKIVENGRYMFKMTMPRISERNGPICCYRVYMVRLPLESDLSYLPPPREINVITYRDAHLDSPAIGAYITDVFSNDKYPQDSELIMGDGKTYFVNGICPRCLQKPKRVYIPKPTTTVATTTKEDDYDEGDTTTEGELEVNRERRSYASNRLDFMSGDGDYSKNPMMMDSPFDPSEIVQPGDGRLNSTANYTLFVELIPGIETDEPIYSPYLNPLMPSPTPANAAARSINVTEVILQVTCGILALVLIGMVVFCVMHTRKSRKVPPHAHVELNPIQAAFRYVEQVLSGRVVSGVVAVLPGIAGADLPAAYVARQADSDLGFQKEFEMLPDSFPDRTCIASSSRENQPKNRYPDIKAYDQTRVRLAPVEGVPGSDYINANLVMGYKERKQFICAQGPTETTVNDFWRMIWEHGLELVVMLTNLEEYSKVKCSKYWPDEVRGSKAFGDVLVQYAAEHRYSDYIVRELKISKQPTNSEGQHIVENGGIKRNGDCGDGSKPTSPRSTGEANGGSPSERTVRQFHFLMWKDFAAPEYAHTILKFIKRVNAAWSGVMSPVVVHCSAGVGRTGTLVALDSLLDQLRAEGHVAVYNTVADLRRQRNFLVQSLKQYIFVYRALVEMAHFGDTEIPASRLKTAVDTLRNTPDGSDTSLMDIEFQKILNAPVSEANKSCSAGAAEEVRNRNRSEECLPYDRNRVILTPQPHKDYSTYINASFIEAYDNSEGYILTQDPLPNTIADFWRMVSEHNVGTIVMLSEVGEGAGKCPRYWDDGSSLYDHISVQYDDSDSCPYYTRRQFTVTNTKTGESRVVRHLQYQGWPTSVGAVPEVTRGLADLADAAHHPPQPIVLVHCHLGTERSSMFVALCILISQLRCERRVDVSTVVRKIRSQRAHTIDTFSQYEFLYRAILNYADFHNLMEDS